MAGDGTYSASQTFEWNVNNPITFLSAPTDQTVYEGQSIHQSVVASDASGDVIHYLAACLPAGEILNPCTGQLCGTVAVGTAEHGPKNTEILAEDPHSVQEDDFQETEFVGFTDYSILVAAGAPGQVARPAVTISPVTLGDFFDSVTAFQKQQHPANTDEALKTFWTNYTNVKFQPPQVDKGQKTFDFNDPTQRNAVKQKLVLGQIVAGSLTDQATNKSVAVKAFAFLDGVRFSAPGIDPKTESYMQDITSEESIHYTDKAPVTIVGQVAEGFVASGDKENSGIDTHRILILLPPNVLSEQYTLKFLVGVGNWNGKPITGTEPMNGGFSDPTDEVPGMFAFFGKAAAARAPLKPRLPNLPPRPGHPV